MKANYDTTGVILTGERPIIKIAGEEYEVNNLYQNVMAMTKELEKAENIGNEAFIILDFSLGKEAAKVVKKLELTLEDMTTLVTYLSAAMSGETVEEAGKRFQEEQ